MLLKLQKNLSVSNLFTGGSRGNSYYFRFLFKNISFSMLFIIMFGYLFIFTKIFTERDLTLEITRLCNINAVHKRHILELETKLLDVHQRKGMLWYLRN